MSCTPEYDAATVALRVLRLVTVASIFAFVLVVRTVAPIHAAGDPTDDDNAVVGDRGRSADRPSTATA